MRAPDEWLAIGAEAVFLFSLLGFGEMGAGGEFWRQESAKIFAIIALAWPDRNRQYRKRRCWERSSLKNACYSSSLGGLDVLQIAVEVMRCTVGVGVLGIHSHAIAIGWLMTLT